MSSRGRNNGDECVPFVGVDDLNAWYAENKDDGGDPQSTYGPREWHAILTKVSLFAVSCVKLFKMGKVRCSTATRKQFA